MRRVTFEVGKTMEGKPLYRHQFIYDNPINYLLRAQSYFTKAQKKRAKRKHKRETK